MCPLIVFFTHLLTDFTSLSNIPPHQGAFSRLNVHFICSFAKCFLTPGLFKILVISRAASLDVLPLSDTTNEGLHRLALNLLRLPRDALAVRSGIAEHC